MRKELQTKYTVEITTAKKKLEQLKLQAKQATLKVQKTKTSYAQALKKADVNSKVAAKSKQIISLKKSLEQDTQAINLIEREIEQQKSSIKLLQQGQRKVAALNKSINNFEKSWKEEAKLAKAEKSKATASKDTSPKKSSRRIVKNNNEMLENELSSQVTTADMQEHTHEEELDTNILGELTEESDVIAALLPEELEVPPFKEALNEEEYI